jgi:hypothetical protein
VAESRSCSALRVQLKSAESFSCLLPSCIGIHSFASSVAGCKWILLMHCYEEAVLVVQHGDGIREHRRTEYESAGNTRDENAFSIAL